MFTIFVHIALNFCHLALLTYLRIPFFIKHLSTIFFNLKYIVFSITCRNENFLLAFVIINIIRWNFIDIYEDFVFAGIEINLIKILFSYNIANFLLLATLATFFIVKFNFRIIYVKRYAI
jgi:hypothetical protein